MFDFEEQFPAVMEGVEALEDVPDELEAVLGPLQSYSDGGVAGGPVPLGDPNPFPFWVVL